MKTKEQKSKIIAELSEKLAKYPMMIFAEYHGMTVADFDNLRLKIGTASSASAPEFEVVKNNLLTQALTKTKSPAASCAAELKGPLAVLWSTDIISASKAITDFAKSNQKIKLRFAVADGKLITDKEVTAYSQLPTREVLLAQLAGVLRSPVSGLLGILNAPVRNFVLVLHQKSLSK
ncbi:MAG: 50S ribosomal protein L10 [Elusimicrobia bacterium HGW-Elusimicrobia-1]|jgi:large subunit ribosomal protein L10|nr:MAG: 50S ribosomal protein L10 [Elusimicrobia bacterium HGW-Elusimicrobia-1]